MIHILNIAILFAFFLCACASTDAELTLPVTSAQIAPSVNVVSYDVVIPRSLEVSEANLFYPSADIVWRGDTIGNRYEQVEALANEAMDWGLSAFDRGS